MKKKSKSLILIFLFIFSVCKAPVRRKIKKDVSKKNTIQEKSKKQKKIISKSYIKKKLQSPSVKVNSGFPDKEPETELKYPDVSIIGHRGDMTIPVFNSVQSFKLAKDLGAHGVEFDVRYTRDNVNIIMHTAYLSETTICENGWVHKKTLRELKECKLKNGEPIHTLEEMLLIIKDWYQLSYLEIKTENRWAIQQTKDVVEILLKHKLQNKFIIISYNVKSLLYLSTRLKDGILAGWDSLDDSGLKYAIKYKFPYLIMAERYVDTKNIKAAEKHGIEIVPYRVYTISEFKRLYELGIRSFMVDDNKLFIDYISSKRIE